MKTRLLIITGLIVIISILAAILHTEALGENAAYGECLITASSASGFMAKDHRVF